jgi:hypothetical protein
LSKGNFTAANPPLNTFWGAFDSAEAVPDIILEQTATPSVPAASVAMMGTGRARDKRRAMIDIWSKMVVCDTIKVNDR